MWWEKYEIRCKNKDEYEFWNEVKLKINRIRENTGNDSDVLKILDEIAFATTSIEDERLISVKLTPDEIIRAIDRELKIKEERARYKKIHGRGLGGRKSKVEKFLWHYKHAKSDEEREKILKEAKRELSRTSFWRLKKALKL